MAIKKNVNGTYTIRSAAQAAEALERMKVLQKEIDDIQRKSGVMDMMIEASELKKGATRWAVESGTEVVPLDHGYARMRRDKYDGRWIASDSDMDGAPDDARSLYSIICEKFKKMPVRRKKVWLRVTKRVVDPEALQEVVSEGYLTLHEIQSAFYEKTKEPYLRLYEEPLTVADELQETKPRAAKKARAKAKG
jgi:hypothetical protein